MEHPMKSGLRGVAVNFFIQKFMLQSYFLA